jgi:hypothetical protein
MPVKSDPTKDPEFQKVVRHFLTTPPQPHKPLGKKTKPKKPAPKNKAPVRPRD